MGVIQLQQRHITQPQYSPPPSPEYADAVILSPLQIDGRNIANSNHFSPFLSGITSIVRDHGRATNFSSTGYYRSDKAIDPIGKKFTIFAWVRPSKVHNSYFRFLSTGYTGGIYLGSDSSGKYMFTVNSSALDVNVGGQQVVGKRDFVLGVFDGSSAILYVNGREVSRQAATAATTSQYLGVGADYDGDSNWSGDVDTIGLFYRAFSAGEVLALYVDPWQIFKAPARRLWATSAAPSSFNPAWARNSNVMIGMTR
ncbi:LamG domain-containing protein [Nitrosovibrio sp. Nv4]|uniref:LamG domain-containing protein n=1 Tax=Nitrosovibrio sp. Nv4 TaxID=1945880 RepID=UPI000BD2B107|nr:LamG domain-containing protein [Nitrosovibrio sp. Nv4]SOD41318.1 Concanavalin A-like lectin/glucanases superfamily protein [Nitrosovibrio sp. Nv4]